MAGARLFSFPVSSLDGLPVAIRDAELTLRYVLCALLVQMMRGERTERTRELAQRAYEETKRLARESRKNRASPRADELAALARQLEAVHDDWRSTST